MKQQSSWITVFQDVRYVICSAATALFSRFPCSPIAQPIGRARGTLYTEKSLRLHPIYRDTRVRHRSPLTRRRRGNVCLNQRNKKRGWPMSAILTREKSDWSMSAIFDPPADRANWILKLIVVTNEKKQQSQITWCIFLRTYCSSFLPSARLSPSACMLALHCVSYLLRWSDLYLLKAFTITCLFRSTSLSSPSHVWMLFLRSRLRLSSRFLINMFEFCESRWLNKMAE